MIARITMGHMNERIIQGIAVVLRWDNMHSFKASGCVQPMSFWVDYL